MGWRDVGRLAKSWLDNERTELLTTDRTRHQAERRQELAGQSVARVRVSLTGEITGALEADLPFDSRDDSGPDAGDVPTLWVRVESPDPLPLGTHTLLSMSIEVPHYRGPGRYDLAQLWQQVQAGTLAEWDLLGIIVQLREESMDEDPMWSPDEGPSVIEVTDSSVTFDLGMASAVGSSRATGSIEWGPARAA